MLAYFHSARPRAVFSAAISVGLLAVSGASLRAAEKVPVNTVLTTISGFNWPCAITVGHDSRWVYVLNNGNNTVSVVDAATNQIATTFMNSGKEPVDITVTSDGRKVFVSDAAYAGNEADSGSVTTIATKTSGTASVNTNGPFPKGVGLTPDEKYLWIAEEGGADGVVDIMDVTTGTLSPYPIYFANYGYIADPQYVAFSPNGKSAYISDNYGGVWVFNAARTKLEQGIATGTVVEGMCVSPDGNQLYALSLGAVSIINTHTRKVTATVSLPVTQYVTQAGNKMALTPDGNYLYVPIEEPSYEGTGPGSVVMMSTKTASLVGDPIALGDGYHPAVAIAPDGKRGYIINQSDATVTVIGITE